MHFRWFSQKSSKELKFMMLTLMLPEKLLVFLSYQTMSSLVIGINIFNFKMMYNCQVSDNKRIIERMLADSELDDMKTRILARGPTAVRRVKELTSRRPSWHECWKWRGGHCCQPAVGARKRIWQPQPGSGKDQVSVTNQQLELENISDDRIRSVKGMTLLLPIRVSLTPATVRRVMGLVRCCFRMTTLRNRYLSETRLATFISVRIGQLLSAIFPTSCLPISERQNIIMHWALVGIMEFAEQR